MQDELSGEELENFTKDINAVLEKYNCEMGVRASIQILKTHGGETKENTNSNSDRSEDHPKDETQVSS